ncbi:MAG: sulfotransferase family protein [Pseudarcicella sp.]|nr:sulfotransferase family protein [Pseudarcicella sp.]
MKDYILKNWIPYKLDYQETNDILCQWLYLGENRFTEPFFEETTGLCRRLEINRNIQKSCTTFDGINDFSENIPHLEPTAFIFHISRCGSTLLAQLLSLDEQNIVVSEAPILDEIIRNVAYKSSLKTETEINNAIKSCIKLLGKKRSGNEENFFIKLDSWHIFYYQKLRQLYPNTPFIFSYRNPSEVIRSQEKNSGMHASPGIIQIDLFGLDFTESLKLSKPEYISKVLESYFNEYLKIIDSDKNCIFVNYNNGLLENLNQIKEFLKLHFSEEFKEKITERSKFHSKMPNQIFKEPAISTTIPEYQNTVKDLYEKLNGLVEKL